MKKKYEIAQFIGISTIYIRHTGVSLPSWEIFSYIYEKAKTGNEMAAALIFEWVRFCSPARASERWVYECISCAFNELFKLQ